MDEPILAEGFLPPEHHLVTVVLDLAHVHAGQYRRGKTLNKGNRRTGDENIFAHLPEIVEVERKTVQKIDVETVVLLPCLFPFQIRIAQQRGGDVVAASQRRKNGAVGHPALIVSHAHVVQIEESALAQTVITHDTVRCADLEEIDPFAVDVVLEELLLAERPAH